MLAASRSTLNRFVHRGSRSRQPQRHAPIPPRREQRDVVVPEAQQLTSSTHGVHNAFNAFTNAVSSGTLPSGRHPTKPGSEARQLLLDAERQMLTLCALAVDASDADPDGAWTCLHSFLVACAAGGLHPLPDAALLALYVTPTLLRPRRPRQAGDLLMALAMAGAGSRAMHFALIENVIAADPMLALTSIVSDAIALNAPQTTLRKRAEEWVASAQTALAPSSAAETEPRNGMNTATTGGRAATADFDWRPWRKPIIDRHLLVCARNRSTSSPHRRHAMSMLASNLPALDSRRTEALFDADGTAQRFIRGHAGRQRRWALLRRACALDLDPALVWRHVALWGDLYAHMDVTTQRHLIHRFTQRINGADDLEALLADLIEPTPVVNGAWCGRGSSGSAMVVVRIEPLLRTPLAWRTLRHCAAEARHGAMSTDDQTWWLLETCLSHCLPAVSAVALLQFMRHCGQFPMRLAHVVAWRCSSRVWAPASLAVALPMSRAAFPVSKVCSVILSVMILNDAASRCRDRVNELLPSSDDDPSMVAVRHALASAAQRNMDASLVRLALTSPLVRSDGIAPHDVDLVGRRFGYPLPTHPSKAQRKRLYRFVFIGCLANHLTIWDIAPQRAATVAPRSGGTARTVSAKGVQHQSDLSLKAVLRLLLAEGSVPPSLVLTGASRHDATARHKRNRKAMEGLQYVASMGGLWAASLPAAADDVMWDAAFADALRWSMKPSSNAPAAGLVPLAPACGEPDSTPSWAAAVESVLRGDPVATTEAVDAAMAVVRALPDDAEDSTVNALAVHLASHGAALHAIALARRASDLWGDAVRPALVTATKRAARVGCVAGGVPIPADLR